MMKTNERIQHIFTHGKAFVGYLTVGDGGVEKTLAAARALIAGGVNILELGMPFSDPIADGPVIQRAAMRALASHTTLNDVLWVAQEIRQTSDIPLILFTYFNPVLSVLNTSFFNEAKQAGINGILVVDCPVEEMGSFHQRCLQEELAPIYVITPSTPLQRMRKIDRFGRGFLYYACRKGTTGLRNDLPDDFAEKMQLIKSTVHLPVVVGFGISGREMAEKVLQYADGVVVGSLFVKTLEEGVAPAELTSLARTIYPGEEA